MNEAGRLVAVMGASRSGKSAYVNHATKREPRLVWDIKGEYSGHTIARDPKTLATLIRAKPSQHLVYVPRDLSEFEFFCTAARAWIKTLYAHGNRGAVILEETADVTSPGKAPPAYGILLRRYLAFGSDIYAITQRPAESDKTSIGNASEMRICRISLARDRKAAADNSGIPLPEIEKLRADHDAGRYDYIHADVGRGRWWSGNLQFPKGRPRFRDNAEKYL